MSDPASSAGLSTKGRASILLFAAFTIFMTWRAKALEVVALRTEQENHLMGKAAPKFTLTALDGRAVSLDDFHGKKKVVVSFWASWCGPCRMELPVLQEIYKRNHNDSSDFEVLAISTDDEKAPVDVFATEEKLSFPILLDTAHQAADAYGVSAIPYLLVIDQDGKVILEHVGFDMALELMLKDKLGIKSEAAGITLK